MGARGYLVSVLSERASGTATESGHDVALAARHDGDGTRNRLGEAASASSREGKLSSRLASCGGGSTAGWIRGCARGRRCGVSLSQSIVAASQHHLRCFPACAVCLRPWGSWDRWLSYHTVFQIGGRLTSRPRPRHRRQRATGVTSWSAGGPGPGRGTVTCHRRHTLHGHGEIQQISALRISQATATRACLSPTETCSSLPGTSNTPPQ